ncbi:UDP-2,4-diacetamido-2,4,6-trideoxy-beta-L-altropyranose hydrolase [Patescibacteria group bacterium]|nr:UDP-2,4-diacetamido-2,4,6-trideoxy-beta-L-altropyranose hydrolase [Patescibacteria group bacterium]MBU1123636.1 UDP-2,4-diacetamido-2,4,6-trideoxy-beta-L-altropyranose hydrolase [Patescibacteria group bacterium]
MSTILFRTDASTTIGTGHVMRCLALAQEALDQGHKAIFLMLPGADHLKERLTEEGCEVIELKSSRASTGDIKETAELFKESGALCAVVDGYAFGDDYQKGLKEAGVRFLLIDDYGHAKKYSADFILNQNAYAKELESIYSDRPDDCELLLGHEFVLFRREFKNANPTEKVPEKAKKILVTLGGGDPDNITLRIVQLLKQVADLDVTVVVGSAHEHLDQIKSEAQGMKVICDAHNMEELITEADLAIAAGGTTSYELAFMGVPALMFIFADNQIRVAEDLDRRGVVKSLGWARECSNEEFLASLRAILADQGLRQRMSETGKSLIDGGGTKRVLDKLLNL